MAENREHKKFLLLPAILLFLTLAVTTHTRSEEDSFIYYRYALNWAAGHGLVFNRGELVEGYSSPIWMMILAVAAKLRLDLPLAAPALGVACGVLTIVTTYSLAVRLKISRFSRAAAVLGLAAFYPFVRWSSSGLDTPLYALMLVAFAVFYLSVQHSSISRKNVSSWHQLMGGIGIALVALSRPEGILVVLVVALDRFLDGRDYAGFLRYVAPVLLAYGVLLAWRHATYGCLTPNTSVKVHPETLEMSTIQLLDYFLYLGVLPVVVPIVNFVRKHRRNTVDARRLTFLATIVLVVSVFYVVVTGGDYNPFFRFLVPSAPILLILFWASYEALDIEGLQPLRRFPRVAIRSVILCILLFSSIKSIIFEYSRPDAFRSSIREWVNPLANVNDFFVVGARWIIDEVPSNSVVAYGEMGKAPYYAMRAGREIRFIDTLGLTDRETGRIFRLDSKIRTFIHELLYGGHSSFKEVIESAKDTLAVRASEYILGRAPDVIMIEWSLWKNGVRPFAALLSNEKLRKDYVRLATVPSEAEPMLFVYARTDGTMFGSRASSE